MAIRLPSTLRMRSLVTLESTRFRMRGGRQGSEMGHKRTRLPGGDKVHVRAPKRARSRQDAP
jgi:hypothetical protein